jgi:hypothetical protein
LAIGTSPVETDVMMEDAEALGLAGTEGQVEVLVDVDDLPALETDEVVVGPWLRIEAGLAAAYGQLMDPPLPLKAAEDVVDGRKGHRREARLKGPMDLLGRGMALVALEISGDGQLLGRSAGPLWRIVVHGFNYQ